MIRCIHIEKALLKKGHYVVCILIELLLICVEFQLVACKFCCEMDLATTISKLENTCVEQVFYCLYMSAL